jgi:hypothetical protein
MKGIQRSRIDYIVNGNPEGVRKLVYDLGYEAPDNNKELSQVVRQLIRREGRSVTEALVKLHPDKEVILDLEKDKKEEVKEVKVEKKECDCNNCQKKKEIKKAEDSFCGCQHYSYTGSPEQKTENLASMAMTELQSRYESLVKKSTEHPEDTSIQKQVMQAWDELRNRIKNDKDLLEKTSEEKKDKASCVLVSYKEGLLILGLTLFAGLIMGVTLSGIKK